MTLHDRALTLQDLLAADGITATVEECRHLIICDFIEQVLKKVPQNA